ncbi:hypothetical protein, partial [Pseudarthrobacter oxydans]|uniref:hypothetical protein n=1 Tax=Pseudarthrobacter oxydans TaxID=1671 RepID=UPI0038062028
REIRHENVRLRRPQATAQLSIPRKRITYFATSTLRIASDESIVRSPGTSKEFSNFLEIPRNLRPDGFDVPRPKRS